MWGRISLIVVVSIFILGNYVLAQQVESGSNTIQIHGVIIFGQFVFIYEVNPASPDACPEDHLHAYVGGFVTAINGDIIFDPDPGGCGYGILADIVEQILDVVPDLTEMFTLEANLDSDPGNNAPSIGVLTGPLTIETYGNYFKITGPSPWVTLEGTIYNDDTFEANGYGTVAGIPDVWVFFSGTVNPDGSFIGSLVMGADGELGQLTYYYLVLTPSGPPPPANIDGDAYDETEDCNDNDQNIYPGATEIPYDGIDQDCSGADLRDVDGDSFDSDIVAGPDCDDGDAAINPAATEIVGNSVDEDCDGIAEPTPPNTDVDGDLYHTDGSGLGLDCDDGDAAINPAATEIVGNSVDEDCDGIAEQVPPNTDADDDGYHTDGNPADCDDTDAAINPSATEIVGNSVDEDCDGIAEQDTQDADDDGYYTDGNPADCDDTDAAINPSATEVVGNSVDENCDGIAEQVPQSDDESYVEAYNGLVANPFMEKVPQTIVNDLTGFEKPEPAEEPKLDTKIIEIQKVDDPKEFAKKAGLDFKDDQVRVLIEAKISENLLSKISEFGKVETVSTEQIQAIIQVSKILEINEFDGVKNIKSISKPIQMATSISEGVEFINADYAQENGHSGKGIKVAVLDLAFDTTNSKISDNIKDSKSFRFDFGDSLVPVKGNDLEYMHGTAVAEIIADVAPDVDLYLYTFGTELEFEDAASEAIKNNVDLVAMSAGWINYPTDGKSHMTKKVEEVIDSGIPFIISAGNYAETHWQGSFVDSDSNGWHEFEGKDEGLSFAVSSSRVNNVPIIVYMMWPDTSSKNIDLDLSLTDSSGNVVAHSSNVQEDFDNFEYIYYTPEKADTYNLGVTYSGSKPSVKIEIFSQSDRIEHATASSSVGVPTDAAGVVAVGAVHHSSVKVEPFSSQGPTNHGKTPVPNVVGPDAVSTIAYGQSPFYGTSAAAPHVAGIAALILEKYPNITPEEVTTYLNHNTDKKTISISTRYDNQIGYGKADATFLVEFGKSSILIPDWVKNNADWWADRVISDNEFASAVQFMIKEKIIVIPTSTTEKTEGEIEIPDWVRSNAEWWSDDMIADEDFASGLQYLISIGIISV